MFIKSKSETKLDAEILVLLDKLESLPDKKSEEYAAILDRVSTLNKLKIEGRSKQISPDTVIVVAANIFGILWLTRFEKEHVIPSKSALGLVMKPRV